MIEVVAAIIFYGEKVLCCKRPQHKHGYLSNKFEFPGGKIEANETVFEATRREIREELSLPITTYRVYTVTEHHYPDLSVRLTAVLCKSNSEEIQLNEHVSACWLPLEKLKDLDWAAADIPIVQQLQQDNPISSISN